MNFGFSFKHQPVVQPMIIGHEAASEEKALQKLEKKAKTLETAYRITTAVGFGVLLVSGMGIMAADSISHGIVRHNFSMNFVNGILGGSAILGFVGLGGLLGHCDALNDKKRALEHDIKFKPSAWPYGKITDVKDDITGKEKRNLPPPSALLII